MAPARGSDVQLMSAVGARSWGQPRAPEGRRAGWRASRGVFHCFFRASGGRWEAPAAPAPPLAVFFRCHPRGLCVGGRRGCSGGGGRPQSMGRVTTAPPRVAGCAAAAGGCGRAGRVGAVASQTCGDVPGLQVESTWWRPCLSDQHAIMCTKPSRKSDLHCSLRFGG